MCSQSMHTLHVCVEQMERAYAYSWHSQLTHACAPIHACALRVEPLPSTVFPACARSRCPIFLPPSVSGSRSCPWRWDEAAGVTWKEAARRAASPTPGVGSRRPEYSIRQAGLSSNVFVQTRRGMTEPLLNPVRRRCVDRLAFSAHLVNARE